MSEFAHRLQSQFKKSSVQALALALRVFMGLTLGVTVATVLQVLIPFENLIYIFFTVVTTLVFLRLTKGWSFVRVLVLALVLILAAMLLRLYIMMAAA